MQALLVEDEAATAAMLQEFLQLRGFRVWHAADGLAAMALVDAQAPDLALAILDVMVPGADGRAVLRHIRAHPSLAQLPVIMLTAMGQEQDEIRGLQLGADDYIAKPASLHLIGARIDSLLRRKPSTSSSASTQPLQWGNLVLDTQTFSMTIGRTAVSCTVSEFKLLQHLVQHPHQAHTRQALLAVLAGEDDKNVFDRIIDVHIKNLRAKLPCTDPLVLTVRGVGYRINPDYRQ